MVKWTDIIYLLIFASVELLGMDNKKYIITFHISQSESYLTKLTCDHNLENIEEHKYTILEGQYLKLKTEPNYFGHLSCSKHIENGTILPFVTQNFMSYSAIAHRYLSGLWNCTASIHLNISQGFSNMITNCYMKIHIRSIESPMTTLVNNMVVEQVRTNLSEKEVDYTAQYGYAEGDLVNVTCLNQYRLMGTVHGYGSINLEYSDIIVTPSPKYTNMTSSISMRVRLHSRHNNTHVLCTYRTPYDEAKVMITFIMRTRFDYIASLRINGMILRPPIALYNGTYSKYYIECMFVLNEQFNVVFQVNEKLDSKLVHLMFEADKIENNYTTATVGNIDTSFFASESVLKSKWVARSEVYGAEDILLDVLVIDSEYMKGLKRSCALQFALPSNEIQMEFHHISATYFARIIYYEFHPGEEFAVECSSDCVETPTVILESSNGTKTNMTGDILKLQDKTAMVCHHRNGNVVKEIRVVFIRIVNTTATTTLEIVKHEEKMKYVYYAAAAVTVVIVTILVMITVIKLKCFCKRQRLTPTIDTSVDPNTVYYENLLQVFQGLNERERQELENQYDEIHL